MATSTSEETPTKGGSRNLTEGSLTRHLLGMSLPMVIGLFAVIAFNVADTYFIAQLGTEPLAAISLTFPVVMGFGSLTMGLGVGASSVIARAFGQGDRQQVRRLTTHALLLCLVVVAFFLAIGILTIEPLFAVLGAKPKTMPLVKEYMEIWYIGVLFLVIPMVSNGAIRAIGDARFPAMVMVVAGLVNFLLDPLLIFGMYGFPKLGIRGAAIATVISRMVTFLASMWVLQYREKLLEWKLPVWNEVWTSWKGILYVGVPSAGNQIVNPLSIGIITAILSVFGTHTLAAYGVATRIESISMIGIFAVSAGIAPILGQNWGAQQLDRVTNILRIGFFWCMGYGIVIAIALYFTAPWLVGHFDKHPEVIRISSSYLMLVPISYAGMGIFLVSSSTFNAIGHPLPSTVLTLLRAFVLYVPLAYLGCYLYKEQGVFLAASIANVLVGLAAYIWTRHTYKALTSADTPAP